MSDELPNVITPRALAAALIYRNAREALADADVSPPGGPAWVFFMRLAELLTDAAADMEAVTDPPE